MRSTDTPPWAVILAGGDGTRLRSLTRHLTGTACPKQFCRLLGSDTLLDETRRRADLLVRPDRQIVVVTRIHQPYYADLARELLPGRLLVQPANRGTAPPILLSALAVRRLAGDAPIVVLPSDHDIEDPKAFMAAVAHAIGVVEGDRDRVVLVGIDPRGPETEYGWIEPLPATGSAVAPVRRFWEKPSAGLARLLLRRGGLWNSFVMVGWSTAFERLIEATVPELTAALAPAGPLLGTVAEEVALDRIYGSLPTIGFSEAVLMRAPDRLGVARVKDVGWSDLGSVHRVAEAVRRRGHAPRWLTEAAALSA